MSIETEVVAQASGATTASDDGAGEIRFASGIRDALRSVSLIIACAVLLTVIAWAVAPGLFTGYSPIRGDTSVSFSPPSLAHPFGTDRLGRDLLARVIHGAGTTLSSTLLAVAIGFVIGAGIGLVSGFLGGRADSVIMRFIDVLLSIPGLLLAMTVVAALGYGTLNIAIAVGVSSVAAFSRVMRSEVLKVALSDYVEAGYLLGGSHGRVLVRHILPNAIPPAISLAALEVGSAVLAVSALGFLGYGAPPPQPEWGLAVAEGRDYLAHYPWVSLIPGGVIAAVVMSTNRVSSAVGGRR